MQDSENDLKLIRVKSAKRDNTRQLFMGKISSEHPIMLSNSPLSPSRTMFFNYCTVVKDVPAHSVGFKFCLEAKQNITKINFLQKDYSSGFFTLSGSIKLLAPPHQAKNCTKSLYDAIIAGNKKSLQPNLH